MNRWLGLLLGLLLYVTGYFCYGTPLRWIEPLSFVHLLGTFFFFLFWLGSLWGWGRCLQSLSPWQQNPAWLSAVFGTFALMAVAFLLFLSPVISLPTKKLIALAFLVVGYLWTLPPNWKPPALSSLWSEHWTFMLLVLGGVALFVMLGLPHPFWDSMWYHLPASQHWYQQNAIVFNPSALVMTKGSFWEYLFLWSHLLLAKPGGFGLLTTQIFCQWIHICLGFFLSLWILHSLLTRIFNIQERYWLALLAMFCFTNYGLHYATLAPKPDWGVIAWYLAGVYFLLIESSKARAKATCLSGPFLAGLLFGACFGAKLSYGFALLLLPVFFLLRPSSWSETFRMLGAFVLGGIILGLPNSIRNFIWTGNPVFPAMPHIFPTTYLGPSWIQGIRAFDGGSFLGAANLAGKWKLLLPTFQWYAYAFFLVPLAPLLSLSLSKKAWRLWGFTFTTLALFALSSGAKAEFRLIGGVVVLFHLCTLLFYVRLFERWLQNKTLLAVVVGALFCYQCFYPRMFDVPTFQAKERWFVLTGQSSISTMMKRIPGVNYTDFILRKLPPKEKLYILSDTKMYYFAGRKVERVWDNPALDRQLSKVRTFREQIEVLRRNGGRYLADSIHSIDTYYNKRILRQIIFNLRYQPQAILYNHDTNWVVDLNKIKFRKRSEVRSPKR